FEKAVGYGAYVGGEAKAENVEGVDFAGGVGEADEIDRSCALFEQGPDGGFRAGAGEIAEKRVAGAERKKTERYAIGTGVTRKDAVQDFMSGAIAAYCKKAAVALGIGFVSEIAGVTGSGRYNDVDVEPAFAQSGQSGAGEFCGDAAAGGGIDDGEETVFGS